MNNELKEHFETAKKEIVETISKQLLETKDFNELVATMITISINMKNNYFEAIKKIKELEK